MMKFLLSPKGRISRKTIWLFALAYVGLSLLLTFADKGLGFYSAETDIGVLTPILSIVMIWPSIALSVKRFHDRGMSGWWVLWFALLTILPLAFLFGTPGTDSVFGEDGPTPIAWLVLAVAGCAQIVQFIIVMILPGQTGDNKYGADPLAK